MAAAAASRGESTGMAAKARCSARSFSLESGASFLIAVGVELSAATCDTSTRRDTGNAKKVEKDLMVAGYYPGLA